MIPHVYVHPLGSLCSGPTAYIRLVFYLSVFNGPLLFFGQMMDFIEENFLEEQVESIKQFSDYVTSLKRVGPGLGEFQFDKLTLKDS